MRKSLVFSKHSMGTGTLILQRDLVLFVIIKMKFHVFKKLHELGICVGFYYTYMYDIYYNHKSVFYLVRPIILDVNVKLKIEKKTSCFTASSTFRLN